jgi:hypothetical protein
LPRSLKAAECRFQESQQDKRRDAASTLSRREFLRTAATAATVAAPWLVPASAVGADGAVPPSDRLTMGLIGVGCMGSGHLGRLAGDKEIQLLAVCDVDSSRRERACQRVEDAYAAGRADGTYRGCAGYNDYRRLLARQDIDGVVIVTPDHWHALQAIHAVQAGKDVYCEKPVSLTIRQGRQMVEAVRRGGRVFQTGTQYRSIPAIRTVCEFVRRGGLGRVKQVFTTWEPLANWLTQPRCLPYSKVLDVAKFGPSPVPLDFPLPAEPVPEGLDWDLWVGPALWHAYNPVYHLNPSPGVVPWSICEDFGAASVTWFHSHAADVIQYALGKETTGPVEIHHPADGRFPTLTCQYADGTLLHHLDRWSQVSEVYHAVPATARLAGLFGGLFVGERGWVTSMTGMGPIEGSPRSIFREMKLASRDPLGGANNHHANWFECIRTRSQPSAHEEIGHRSASLGHLVILAYRLGRSLKWDPINEEFPGDEQANRLLGKAMREPWR